ncbi:glycerophosphodiester phosphodiesterase family protein [Litoribacter populi]|uniref:glycerophosphodiester phosphodiesterase family protein n=1 Tax=Litoribacter populi TaxID=2598460 RepID=UPI00117E3AF9|nr:glycerophosphodiester phosphodiesterase family protein [Litoribacter populi]
MRIKFSIFLLFILHSLNANGQSLREMLLLPEPIVCSHRGVTDPEKMENSIFSMNFSQKAGIKMHEIDIMETKDGELFLLHDKTLDRTTDLSGKIAEKTAEEIRKGKLLITEEPIASLKETLSWAKDNEAFLMLDAKEAPVHTIMNEVKTAKMLDQVMILTFSRERAREAFDYEHPYFVSVLITSEEDIQYYKDLSKGSNYLIGYVNKNADLELYEKVRKANIPVVTDTMGEFDLAANKEGLDVYREFFKQRKPSILVSDYPLLLQEAISE